MINKLALLPLLTIAFVAQAGVPSLAGMQAFPGVDNLPQAEDYSALTRYKRSIRLDVSTSGLDPLTPYTLWAVVFNNPRYCQSTPCSLADLSLSPGHDPRVDATIVFAGGGMSDAAGRGRFLGRVRKSGGRINSEIVLGTGTLNAKSAEVHTVIRAHGQPEADQFFPSLSSFNGGCSATNVCEDQQFAIHLGD